MSQANASKPDRISFHVLKSSDSADSSAVKVCNYPFSTITVKYIHPSGGAYVLTYKSANGQFNLSDLFRIVTDEYNLMHPRGERGRWGLYPAVSINLVVDALEYDRDHDLYSLSMSP